MTTIEVEQNPPELNGRYIVPGFHTSWIPDER